MIRSHLICPVYIKDEALIEVMKGRRRMRGVCIFIPHQGFNSLESRGVTACGNYLLLSAPDTMLVDQLGSEPAARNQEQKTTCVKQ